MERVCVILFIFATFLNRVVTSDQIFASMAAMENLASWESDLVKELTSYVKKTESKISGMKRFTKTVEEMAEKQHIADDAGAYLGNPLNAFRMLKRFNVQWSRVNAWVKMKTGNKTRKILEYLGPYLPANEDIEGAMEAIFRLQETYNLTASSLARGIIKDVHFANHSLGIRDILRFGKHAYMMENWKLSVQWLEYGLDVLNQLPPGDERNREKIEIVDYLAFAYEKAGNVQKAFKVTLDAANSNPKEEKLQENLVHFEKVIQNSPQDDLRTEEEKESEEIANMPAYNRKFYLDIKRYKELCRGETRKLTANEERKLMCWYRRTNPVLRLKPQKVERKWANPEILLLHDIITDEEANWIKNAAYPQLRMATIYDPNTGELTSAKYRVSKSAWLSPNAYPQIEKLKTRAKAATGLNFKYAEDLQVANYGLAGQYEPHVDHSRETEPAYANLKKNNMGNRIATFLFYLNDVTAGGSTVFTKAGAVVKPVRNAAVFWYNLKRNGRGNERTRHAACPVLVGHKWVSNWWISEFGQEFRRRCHLNPKW